MDDVTMFEQLSTDLLSEDRDHPDEIAHLVPVETNVALCGKQMGDVPKDAPEDEPDCHACMERAFELGVVLI